jgi:hypothetical protein
MLKEGGIHVRRKSTLFVTGVVVVAAVWALAPAASAGHYGVDVWIMQPTTVYNADPASQSPNALLNDGKGPYWETPDNFARLHEYAVDQPYTDYFLIRDQKGSKRYFSLNIPGVTNGTVTCWKDLIFYQYGFGDRYWFKNLAPGATMFGYGNFECNPDDVVRYSIVYPKETWCTTITRLPDTAAGKKAFRFSAPEECMANVTKTTKTGKNSWVKESFPPMPVPFDVDSVADSKIKTA